MLCLWYPSMLLTSSMQPLQDTIGKLLHLNELPVHLNQLPVVCKLVLRAPSAPAAPPLAPPPRFVCTAAPLTLTFLASNPAAKREAEVVADVRAEVPDSVLDQLQRQFSY